ERLDLGRIGGALAHEVDCCAGEEDGYLEPGGHAAVGDGEPDRGQFMVGAARHEDDELLRLIGHTLLRSSRGPEFSREETIGVRAQLKNRALTPIWLEQPARIESELALLERA